ncbi:MAG: trypsin-like peptidase domain-containing protein [Thermoguttaceae bacterium]|jgi:serine protease Do
MRQIISINMMMNPSSFSRGACAARFATFASVLLFFASVAFAAGECLAETAGTLDQVQAKIVKIYGAGGYRGLEAYQSGMLISPQGHILTAYSYVLDTDYITAYLADGRKFEAKLLGADPRLEAAVLKINADDLPYFDLDRPAKAEAGSKVLALSNVFNVAQGDEPASVQHGIVSAIAKLEARRGAFETPYRGPVYVLDAKTNNPGSAGGALVNRRGELLAMLGKELRNSMNNTWLNYAVPIEELRGSVQAIRGGKFVAQRESDTNRKPPHSLTLEALGIVLVPDVLERTPPYVEQVRPGSPAEKAGLKPDDLVVLLGDQLVQSCKLLRGDLEYVDAFDSVKITVLRGRDLMEFTLSEATPKKDTP